MKIKRSGFKNLIRMMKSLEERVQQCNRCGMCQSVCPLYAATGHEKDVARGKLQMLDGLMREMFQNPGGVSARINHCLLCGSCEAGCPRQVSVMEIFLTARAIITAYQGLSKVKKFFFRRIMAHPDLFDRLMEWGAGVQYLFMKPLGKTPASCSQLVSPILSNRNLVAIAKVPFHQKLLHAGKSSPSNGPKVAFFVGCLLDKLFPETAQTIIKILGHHGANVIIPKNQGCCGIPMMAAGDRESFNQLVDHHIRLLNAEEFDYLVTGCATCTATIKKIWPSMAEAKSFPGKESLIGLAEKTMDISEFLVNVMGVSPRPNSRNNQISKSEATYHDPCHLRKTLKIYKEPRILIQASSKYQLKEMSEAETCCGMGGSFNLRHYKTSTEIGLKKIDHIKASGATVVATACPACMVQISDMMAKTKTAINVRHVVEIYSDGLL
ncbi:MAG: (Fe-S)-binding protein [Desulfobacterales bacterium]|nr:(Fe-S)-binding protein [Desulfobacterales bacterium]